MSAVKPDRPEQAKGDGKCKAASGVPRGLLAVSLLLMLAVLSGCGGVARGTTANERACRELLGVASGYLVYRDLDGFCHKLIDFVREGGDPELRAVFVLCTGSKDESVLGAYGDTLVRLLRIVGDKPFARVLEASSDRVRSDVAHVLAQLVWNIDDDESYERALAKEDATYPRTWRVVMKQISAS